MTPEHFIAARQHAWGELRMLLSMSSSKRQLQKLGGDRVRRMGDLYREVAADLAVARLRFPDLAPGLSELVREAHATLYQPRAPGARAFVDFIRTGFPRLVREEWRFVLIGLALLMGPYILTMIWGILSPTKAGELLPEFYRELAIEGPRTHMVDPGVGAAVQGTHAFTSIVLNNVQVTFTTFAGGVLFGLGAAYILILNGTTFGTLTGLMIAYGHGVAFFALIAPHGVLELSCITLAGAAGARIGWSLVDPGPLRRGEALALAAGRAVRIIVGVSVFLFIAALIEGYVTPSSLFSPLTKIIIGIVAGGTFWVYIAGSGRTPREEAPTAEAVP